jgi:glycosyltransferase involved in cell wall biosynthesis
MFIVYEPLCTGPEHVEFNAALLSMVRAAFPGEDLIFCGEPQHLALVASRLKGLPRARFVAVRTPERLAPPLKRFGPELFAFSRLLRFASNVGARGLILASIASEGLVALKAALLRARAAPPIAVVFHAVLESLAQRPPRHPLARLFSLRSGLRIPSVHPLRYVVLSKAFENRIRLALPAVADQLLAIEHPYMFPDQSPPAPLAPAAPLTFGTVGVAKLAKGFAAWAPLAESVRATVGADAVSFAHIGLVVDPTLVRMAESVRLVTAKGWTDRADYERELAALDYVVFLYPPDSYALTASGAFMDALSFGKPVIALRTPYFEHCFALLGDIGYLCDSIDHIRELMVTLVRKPPTLRYAQQQATILQQRRKFSPEGIALSFAESWRRAFG